MPSPSAAAFWNSGRRLWYQPISACMAGMSRRLRLQTISPAPMALPSKLMSATLYSMRTESLSPSFLYSLFCARPLSARTFCSSPKVATVSATAMSILPT
ncbi:hypothetical protein D3C76_1663460 [compost metagenome]